MRGLIFDGVEPKLVSAVPEPDGTGGDALIRPLKVAVGADDVAVCRGVIPFTGVLGHQFVGVVESDGELAGRRVVGSVHAVCGTCDMCRRGLRSHCRTRTVLGMRGRDGCLADRFLLPAENLVPVPEAVDDDHAVFAHLLASAVQAARQITIEGKPYITVLGDTPIGMLAVQLMSKLNASVRLIGHHGDRLARCEKWGVKHRHLDDIGRRADQDIVVDCTGGADGVNLALQLVRPRGKVLLKSMAVGPAGAAPLDLAGLVLNEIELIGSASGPVAEALGMIERDEVDVLGVIGRRMRLAEGAAIIRAAAEEGALAVVVEI